VRQAQLQTWLEILSEGNVFLFFAAQNDLKFDTCLLFKGSWLIENSLVL